MIIDAKQYWTSILKECMIKTNMIPKRYYYLITGSKKLQKYIDDDVIEEFLSDNAELEMLLREIEYTNNLSYNNKFYMTSSYDTNDVEEIIKNVYNVRYVNDESVDVEYL